MIDASWVIVERATDRVVLETFNFELCQFVNIDRYMVVPIRTWLGLINRMSRQGVIPIDVTQKTAYKRVIELMKGTPNDQGSFDQASH